MVYVISKDGKPLMPTKRHGKVRRWLKANLAKVVSHIPFETKSYTQFLTLGIDPGFATVGLSVVSEKEEVLSAEVKLRPNISDLITKKKNVP